MDRSRVITAGTIMQKTEAVTYDSDGPHVASRKMRQLGLSTLMVVDTDRRYKGYVRIDDTIALEKKHKEGGIPAAQSNIDAIIRTDAFTTSMDTPIMDMLNEASQTTIPFAVLDGERRLKGIVTRPAILAGIAGD